MKNKLTAILALLLAAVMLAGCTAHVENQDNDKDNENIDISVKVTPTVEPTVEPTGDTRELHYVVWDCQWSSESFNYKGNSMRPIYGYNELDDRAAKQAKTMMNTDDITEFIPLYSYEDVLRLNFVSDDEKSKGRYGHIAYIILDWTKAYAEKAMERRTYQRYTKRCRMRRSSTIRIQKRAT